MVRALQKLLHLARSVTLTTACRWWPHKWIGAEQQDIPRHCAVKLDRVAGPCPAELPTGIAKKVKRPGRSRSSSGERMATQAGARKVSTMASFSGSSVTVQKYPPLPPKPKKPRRVSSCRLFRSATWRVFGPQAMINGNQSRDFRQVVQECTAKLQAKCA